jgi:hypothetical protein
MLSEVKALVEIVQSMLGLRATERARTSTLLDQMAQEMADLSVVWSEVALKVQQEEPVSDSWIWERMLKQRPHFAALEQFQEYLRARRKTVHRPLVEYDGEMIPGPLPREGLVSAFGSELNVQLYETLAASLGIKSQMYSALWEMEQSDIRERAVVRREFLDHAAKLAACAGEMKGIAAMYKAGLTR